jgi:predicted dithiol-disulfide oxidoreductase (DUF899 family)
MAARTWPVYHFMFGPDYAAGCPTKSSIADCFDPLVAHFVARAVTLICFSRAPLAKLLVYRQRIGWRFNWASATRATQHRLRRLGERGGDAGLG